MTFHGIPGIQGVGGGTPGPLRAPDTATPSTGDGDGRFGDLLDGLGALEREAGGALADLAVGGEQDLHDAVLAVEMESIAFELAVQMRNRLVEAYQEIFRMSV